MIDLHIHSNHSDGTDSVLEILKKAHALNLSAISITDHDTLEAYNELENISVSNYYSGQVIPGAEIKTTFRDIPIELLAYNFDINQFKLCKCVNPLRKQQIQNSYLQNFIKIGKSLGIKSKDNIKINDNKHFAAITYYREICKYPENYEIIPNLLNDLPENFYRNTSCNKNSPFYIDETSDNISINSIISDVHKCNGKVFLAHPFEYKLDNLKTFLHDFLADIDIDGIECIYSRFSQQQTLYLISLCRKYKKLISGRKRLSWQK